MKKGFLAFIASALLVLSMTACSTGATETQEQEELSVDEQFVQSLAAGLDARWVFSVADEGNANITKEDWREYISAEYDHISQFDGATFEDPNLGKHAQDYINAIAASNEALVYYGTNQWQSKYSNGIYRDRVIALYKIHSIVPVPVSEANQELLASLISEGEISDMVRTLLGSVQFELIEEDDWDWKTYEAVVENTASTSFEYFGFVIDMIDEDGVTVETNLATTQQWSPGEKTRFTFSTDASFVELSVVSAEWYF